jgi:hypothetical protein
LGLKEDFFSKFSKRIDKRKPIGILMKDIKKNHFKNNILFNDDLTYKNFFCYSNKLEKIQKNDPDFIKFIQ